MYRSRDFPICDQPSPSSLLPHRVFRDISLGGACLIIGLIVGQSSWLDHRREPKLTPLIQSVVPQQSLAQPISLEPGISSVASSWRAMKDQTLSGGDDVYPLVRVESSAGGELPQQNVDTEIEPMAVAAGQIESNDTAERPAAGAVGSDGHTAAASQQSPVQPARALSDAPPSIEMLTTFDLAPPAPAPQCVDGTCQQKMESHGTVLKWADTPADAYRMAREHDKLVFLIHVSGNFEIPGFT